MDERCRAFRVAAKLPPGGRQSGLAERANRGRWPAKRPSSDASGWSSRIRVVVARSPSTRAANCLFLSNFPQVCCRRHYSPPSRSPDPRTSRDSSLSNPHRRYATEFGFGKGNALGFSLSPHPHSTYCPLFPLVTGSARSCPASIPKGSVTHQLRFEHTVLEAGKAKQEAG